MFTPAELREMGFELRRTREDAAGDWHHPRWRDDLCIEMHHPHGPAIYIHRGLEVRIFLRSKPSNLLLFCDVIYHSLWDISQKVR